jgi:hypothetical protein
VGCPIGDVSALVKEFSGSRFHKARDEIDDGGFAGPVWTDNPQQFVGGDVETDPVDRLDPAEGKGWRLGIFCSSLSAMSPIKKVTRL